MDILRDLIKKLQQFLFRVSLKLMRILLVVLRDLPKKKCMKFELVI